MTDKYYQAQALPVAAVDSTARQTAPRFNKRVLRLADVTAAGAGWTEVSVEAGEIALYADDPVDVRLGDGSRIYEAITELRLVGAVRSLQVRLNGDWTGGGRLVLYQGVPYLGVSWQRESFRDRQSLRIRTPALAWALGVAAANESAAPSFNFTAYGQGNIPTEAFYLRQVSAKRTSGVIESIEYIETETGLTRVLWSYHQQEPVTNHLAVVLPEPVRLATQGYFSIRGSVEPGATTVELDIVYNRV